MAGLLDGMPDELYAEDLRQAVIVLASARDLLMNSYALTPENRQGNSGDFSFDGLLAHCDTLAGNNLEPERIVRAVDFLNAIGQKFGMMEGMARAAAGSQPQPESD